MGWSNPAIPWQQLHDILEGKEVKLPTHKDAGGTGKGGTGKGRSGTGRSGAGRTEAGRAPIEHDGGDSPAWSRKRGPYIPLPQLAAGSPGVEANGEAAARGEAPPSSAAAAASKVPYAELHAHSHYSFLDGASSPEELVEEAVRLGLHALAITDHDGFYGVVRLAEAAEAYGLKTVFGAELSLGLSGPQNGVADPEGEHLLVLARGEEGYHRLAGAITHAQLASDAEKGRPVFDP
uniref:PHP domain-containing protein n=1 Tax=Sinomonas sp. G460-2 TaxID=3393464 RepID=UPI0039EE7432